MESNVSTERRQVLNKLARFCSYQERCREDVRRKMKNLGVPECDFDGFIRILEKEGFLNEERFCGLYVRSKLLQNNWGKKKIYGGLISKRIDKKLIDKALNSIDYDDYFEVLKKLLIKKSRETKTDEQKKRKEKMIRYALSKGFAFEEIMQQIKETEL